MPNLLFYVYMKYIWFGLVGFYGISTIVGHLILDLLFYVYIKYIWFGLVGFYGISTLVGHLMPDLLFYVLWRQIKIKRSLDEQPFKSVWELVHLNIVITKRGVYFFRTCEDGAVWHLIPRRISLCSESFLGHIGTAILCGVNLGPDWPLLARGFQISHYTHTHQGH